MSETLVAQVHKTAAEAAAEVCWRQWGALGFLAGGERSPLAETFIDPEALIVLTLGSVKAEPRLQAALEWWSQVGAASLSLPRLDAVLAMAPDDLAPAFKHFASLVVAGGSASGSWKKRAGTPVRAPERIKGSAEPHLQKPGALMLRLRAAFGVTSKADVLSLLLGLRGTPTTVATMEKALGYSAAPLRRTCNELVAAGLLVRELAQTPETGRGPARYAIRYGEWLPLLGLGGEVPPWRFWPQIAAFLLAVARWGDDLKTPTPYLLSSRARTLHEQAKAFLVEHPLALPDPQRYPAETYLEPFTKAVERIADWLKEGVPEPAHITVHLANPPQSLAATVTSQELHDTETPPELEQQRGSARITAEAKHTEGGSRARVVASASGTGNASSSSAPSRKPASITDSAKTMALLPTYLNEIERLARTGEAREHAYRPALQALLEGMGRETTGRGVTAVNEPRRTSAGAPDFVVLQGGAPLGYVEAKDLGAGLDRRSEEQLERYREAFANLLHTDYLTFRWFAEGVERDGVTLAERRGDRIVVRPDAKGAVRDLLGAFFRFEAPTVTTARELATRMAASTRLLRSVIERTFEKEADSGSLHQQFEAFREVLIHDLTPEKFADMYAQTLAYGLFAARAAAPEAEVFSRMAAAARLPRTNPFLRKLFYQIAGPDLDDRIAWLVDDLAALIERADFDKILSDFGRRTRQEDAVVHFYETFLKHYDPALRELRGVYYTPEPVVTYLVRSVDRILTRDFGLDDGLADASSFTREVPEEDAAPRRETLHRVQVLDPAAGTGTFLHRVIRTIYARFEGNEGLWDGYVAQDLLPRLHGFELLMAPYAVAHLKLGLLLQQTGYRFDREERLSLYLTNTLDDAGPAGQLPFARWLAEEAKAANRVKRDVPVMVVLGNPPYSGHSANTGEWITHLMRGFDTDTGRETESYFEVDGGSLGETQVKWLHDDYVKFLRMAQERIVQTGQGVLAFVTNHGFLDNPTFRGMRQSLMTAFDRLYVLDLHGNAKKKETAPGGGRDENVFDIMQGVAISVFVRLADHDDGRPAEVFHADLWGERAEKYAALEEADITTTAWTPIKPHAPRYLFRPVDRTLHATYEEGWCVTDIFPQSSVGIVTARDALTIHFTQDDIWRTVQRFATLSEDDARQHFSLRKDARDWKVALAQGDLRQSGPDSSYVKSVLYRPFDVRKTYYTGTSRGFHGQPQRRVMSHMLSNKSIGLVWTRPMSPSYEFSVLVTDTLIDQCAVGNKSAGAGISYLGPLWLYPEPDAGLFAAGERRANLAEGFTSALAEATGLRYDEHGASTQDTFTPENVFHYIYGVFYAPSYRARYADFLKTDFPRVPLPPSVDAFRALAALGHRLTALHLLREVPAPGVRFPVRGSDTVEKGYPEYVAAGKTGPDGEQAAEGRVYLNVAQYYAGVLPEVWAHEVGGYQVLDKWLKDRRGRTLSTDELRRYPLIAAALAETQRLMADVDKVATDAFGW